MRNPFFVSPTLSASRAGARLLANSFNISAPFGVPINIPAAGGSLSARLTTMSGCEAAKKSAACAPDECATIRTFDRPRARTRPQGLHRAHRRPHPAYHPDLRRSDSCCGGCTLWRDNEQRTSEDARPTFGSLEGRREQLLYSSNPGLRKRKLRL
jgi:hypothetical protein